MPFDRIQLSQEILVRGDRRGMASRAGRRRRRAAADGEGRFPSGARKLPSELVKAVQRERLIMAMLKAASELGYRETNVQDVIDRAGVSRPTFYEHFTNKEDCFLAAFDTSAERLRERIDGAAEGGDVWRDRVRLGARSAARLRQPRAGHRPHPDRRGAGRQRRRGQAPGRTARRLRPLPRRGRPGSFCPGPPARRSTASASSAGSNRCSTPASAGTSTTSSDRFCPR